MTIEIGLVHVWLIATVGVGSITLLVKIADSIEKKSNSAEGTRPPKNV